MQGTTPADLGYGRDHKSPGHYTSLEAVAAWRLEVPKDGRLSPWSACDLWRERVRSELRVVKRDRTLGWWRSAADDEFFRLREMRGLPLSNEKASLLLQGDDLHPDLNEAMLLHGTKRDNLPGILAEGFRLDPVTVGGSSGAAFGDGIYLCDNPGKADQYTVPDAAYDATIPLHQQLYSGPDDHPGHVFYTLVCRVTLGYPALTRESKHVATTVEQTAFEEGEALFPRQQYTRLPCLRSHRREPLYREQAEGGVVRSSASGDGPRADAGARSSATGHASGVAAASPSVPSDPPPSALRRQQSADSQASVFSAPPPPTRQPSDAHRTSKKESFRPMPIRDHSLFALRGRAIRRYREFVVFHPHVAPAYLIAYQRKLRSETAPLSPPVVVTQFGERHEVLIARCQASASRGGVLRPGVFTAQDVGSAIRIRGNEGSALWRDGEVCVGGEPRTVYWGALVRPADVDAATTTIAQVDPQAFGIVTLSNGTHFQNPAAPPQPLPGGNFRKTSDGQWRLRDPAEVRRIRLGRVDADGRVSRLK